MKPDARFLVQKPIPVGGQSIEPGRTVYRTHGCYYLDGGLLPQSYQKMFGDLVEKEEKGGWNYLVPLKTVDYTVN